MSEVTRILSSIEQGNTGAAERLLPLVYDELRRLAALKMAAQPAGHTLQPTALVHEAYLRLIGSQQDQWHNSRHFFAAAAEAMRHILVDAARRKARLKRGGEWQRLDLDALELAADAPPESLLAQPLDSDRDGIDDVYELRHAGFLNSLDASDADLDFDNNGKSNLEEYLVGTDPEVP